MRYAGRPFLLIMKHIITLLLLLPITLMAQTRSVINIGASPNDGTGDTLRTAMQKSNTNFLSLWETVFTNGVTRLGSPINLSGNLTIDGGTNDHSLSIQDMANTSIEGVNADYTGIASLFLDGGEFTLRANTNLYVLTPEVMNLTATAGDLLSLEDPLSGKVSFQSGIPTAVTNLLTKTAGFVSVMEFGAVGDGVTDDAAAIQAAADSASTNNAVLFIPPGSYYITSTITLASHVMGSGAEFVVPSGFADAAIHVNAGSVTWFESKVLILPGARSLKNVLSGFDAGSVGVRLNNLRSCRVYFGPVSNFETGIWIDANTVGNAYNQYHNPTLTNCKVAIQLLPTSGGGFVNQNQFIGGRINQASTFGEAQPGFRHVLLNGNGQSRVNNTTFYSLSMEGGASERWVEIIDGELNVMYHPRFERHTTFTNAISFSYSSPGGTSVVGDARYCIGNRVVLGLLSGGAPVITQSGAGTVADNFVQDETGRVYGASSSVEVNPSRVRFSSPSDSAYRLQIQPASGEINWGDGSVLNGRLVREGNGQVAFRQDQAANTRFTIANYTTGSSAAANLRISSGGASSANFNYGEIYATDSATYTVAGTRFNGRLIFTTGRVGTNVDNGMAFYLPSTNVNSTLDYYIGAALNRSGRWEFDGSFSVERGFNTVPGGLVTLATDDAVITTQTNSVIRIISDSGVATDRTFTLSAGRSGQRLMLFWATNSVSGELVSGAGTALTATWTPNSQGDNIQLIWDSASSSWYETSRIDIP